LLLHSRWRFARYHRKQPMQAQSLAPSLANMFLTFANASAAAKLLLLLLSPLQ
jgi:hypothetical protein